MTDDELRRVYTEACTAFENANEGESGITAGLRAVFEAGRNDGAVYAEHSGEHDRREWHNVATWLHPGEKIVVRYAEPLAKAGKGEG